MALGSIVERRDIKSSLGPFRIFPEYQIIYPDSIIEALRDLYNEYNRAFVPLVEKNREWETDYQYCFPEGVPVNWIVQIDMVGLDDDFLCRAKDMSVDEVREILRRQIFEIENSTAMYNLLEGLFSRDGKDSYFKTHFRAVLDDLRQRFRRPIALLAVTEEKYHAMRASEFGKRWDEQLADEEVFALSGFDRFFGPGDFRRHVEENGGACEYLLYARTSDPTRKLRYPKSLVKHPLLSESEMRRIIKKNTLTLNVDAPDMEYARRINDTKEYMPLMGMAFQIAAIDDLRSPKFEIFLRTQGFNNPEAVLLRCKPAKGTFGCYGHARIVRDGSNALRALRRGLEEYGDYVVQPEMTTPIVINGTDGDAYTFIDRNFFGTMNGRPEFLGGIRNLMPAGSVEARRGRIHGNSSAVYAEIVG